MAEEKKERSNVIWDFIEEDLAAGKNDGRVRTRFPPEDVYKRQDLTADADLVCLRLHTFWHNLRMHA